MNLICFYFIRLYGHVNFPYELHVVINLNMSQLNISECKDELDYITWMPSDRVSTYASSCIIIYNYVACVDKHYVYNSGSLWYNEIML